VRLWRVADGRLLRTLEGHTGSVESVAFSPDGQTLASGSEDHTVRLWRVSDGALLRTLEGHTGSVWSVAFSPDGQTLASGSEDTPCGCGGLRTARLLRTLEGHIWPVRCGAWPSPPMGRPWPRGRWDDTVRLWRVADGRLLRTLEGHTDWVWSVAFSPDGQTLASGSGKHRAAVAGCGRRAPAHPGGAYGFGVERGLLPRWADPGLGVGDHTVRLWRVSDGALLRTLEGHTGSVRSVAFSPDGQTLASGSEDHTVRLWRVADGRLLRTLEGHTNWVWSVAFSPDGTLLASGSWDGTVRLWGVRP
jgi:WD40 repeat protein